MAPSSKSERGAASGGKRGSAELGRGARREHVVRQLERIKISGQLSPRLFRKLPPRVCVSLKSIVDEHFLCAGHIFLGFSKCGRYVLSYTSSSGDDDFSFYIYHLYWWEFNVHSKLKMVRQVRLFQDEEIYSDLYLTVCEWPSDSSKVIVFGFNTRSANGLLMNMMMSDENHRDIYISTVAVPPFVYCPSCRDMAIAHPGDPNAKCLQHGFMLHMKYQVVYPFPTFQPAFQLKKDQVVLLNTSYSLVACAVSVHTSGLLNEALPSVQEHKQSTSLQIIKAAASLLKKVKQRSMHAYRDNQGQHPKQLSKPCRRRSCIQDIKRDDSNFCQILYDRSRQSRAPVVEVSHASLISHCPAGLEEGLERDSCSCQSGTALTQPIAVPPQDIDTHVSPAVAMAKEFVADIFRRAKEARGSAPVEEEQEEAAGGLKCLLDSGALGQDALGSWDLRKTLESCLHGSVAHSSTSSGASSISDMGNSPKESPIANFELESLPAEPGYVNYTKLRYVLEPSDSSEAEDEYEDDKISLPFVVTDLLGRNLKLLKEKAVCQGQYLTVEQLTLDFEYVINEVIRNDASWSKQFCSFSDYDIVILEVCPETNQVIINIGLLLLAFPSPDEEGQLRPKTYHTSLKVAWDLNTGIFVTVSVGDLTEVKGQTSGSVWSSYRKSCVDMVMKWLVPESSVRYVNRMTNEALHKGCSLKFLADNERYTWIVL